MHPNLLSFISSEAIRMGIKSFLCPSRWRRGLTHESTALKSGANKFPHESDSVSSFKRESQFSTPPSPPTTRSSNFSGNFHFILQRELKEMIEAGVVGFKCFLCPSGVDEFPEVAKQDVEAALRELEGTNSVLAVCCKLFKKRDAH